MGKQPAYQFYPNDFDRDTQDLSLSAVGAWSRIMCALWWAQNRGTLTKTLVGWARIIRATVDQTETVMSELETSGVPDFKREPNGDITVTNRRMVREEKDRQQTAVRQRRFYSKHNAEPNAKIRKPNGVSSSSTSSSTSKTTTPLPPSGEIKIPEDLASISGAISDWLEYKREKGQSYKPKGLEMLWKSLRGMPENSRVKAIESSMASNYAGIFPAKDNQNDRARTAGIRNQISGEAKPRGNEYPDR